MIRCKSMNTRGLMTPSLLLLLGFLCSSVALGCSESPTPESEDSGSGPVEYYCPGEPSCYSAWGTTPDCCLTPTAVPAECVPWGWSCPSDMFLEVQCGRLDPVCEGVDAGPSDGG